MAGSIKIKQASKKAAGDFLSVAKRLECDDDKASFEDKLGNLAKAAKKNQMTRWPLIAMCLLIGVIPALGRDVQAVRLCQLVKNPDKYLNKTVRVRGTIRGNCFELRYFEEGGCSAGIRGAERSERWMCPSPGYRVIGRDFDVRVTVVGRIIKEPTPGTYDPNSLVVESESDLSAVPPSRPPMPQPPRVKP